jgi:hypothetical protein
VTGRPQRHGCGAADQTAREGEVVTLALADKPEVDLLAPCGDEPTKTAVLSKLAENAASGSYYYTLSVRDGAVWRVVEHLSVNAC